VKLKILYRRNLKMTPGKIAAQAVHAAIAIGADNPMMSVVVLAASDKKFEDEKLAPRRMAVVRDAGYTEVMPNTETCLAFYED
jgi:peptidyl-tRNA hydrolase